MGPKLKYWDEFYSQSFANTTTLNPPPTLTPSKKKTKTDTKKPPKKAASTKQTKTTSTLKPISNALKQHWYNLYNGSGPVANSIKSSLSALVTGAKSSLSALAAKKIIKKPFSKAITAAIVDTITVKGLPNYVKTANNVIQPFSKWEHLLHDHEKKALKDYTGLSYYLVNEYMRTGKFHEEISPEVQLKTKFTIRDMASAITKAPPTKGDLYVYRGMSAPSTNWKTFQVGDILTYAKEGFVSTSLDPEISVGFMKLADECCFLVLHLPPNSMAVALSQISEFEEEKEVLLPPESKFEITSINENILTDKNDSKTHTVRVIRATLKWQPGVCVDEPPAPLYV